MKNLRSLALGTIFVLALCFPALAAQTVYPVTIDNGVRSVTFESAPSRVVTNCDSNILELMFALGLEDRVVGYAGFPAYDKTVSPKYQEKLAKMHMAAEDYITLEQLLAQDPDFFLSGYYYGLDIPGDTNAAITPDELEKHGVKSYAITESLVRVMKKPPVTLEDTYIDLRSLGRIFDVQDRAEQVITDMKLRVAELESRIPRGEGKLNVFICRSSGANDDAQWGSCGSQAMPSYLLSLAKADNIFSDVEDSWIKVNVEDVIARDPGAIVILEYKKGSGEARKEHMMTSPAFQGVEAVRAGRISVIPVENVYPGPRAVDGYEMMLKALYPAAFK